ncbi:MAG: STAS domain-containing protein [Chitinivibrionales bacterium]|nr:STAS domain-containing protein [Chitinivibrionales bacterium]
MDYSITQHNGYCIICIDKQLSMLSNLDFLKNAVAQRVKKGYKRIAVSFPDASFLSSHSITVLIACNEMVREAEGEFLIAGGGDELERYLYTLGLGERFSLCRPPEEVMAALG